MMNEILCPNCGKSNPPDTEFCETCLTPLVKPVSADSTSTAEGTPDWLQKIREKTQTEKPDTPPLGEFGDAEERPFNEPIVPGEIPDWLKELQKAEPPMAEESAEATSDWMSRLHEILPESDRQTLQSTTFYSDEELAAMAAAARQLEPIELEPPEKSNTRPLDVPPESTPSDFAFGLPYKPAPSDPGETPVSPFSEPDLPEPEEVQLFEGTSPETEATLPELIKSIHKPVEETEVPLPRMEENAPVEIPEEKPVEWAGSQMGVGQSEEAQPAGDVDLFMPPDPEPAEAELKKKDNLFSSFVGQEESSESESASVEKPEQLIPEDVLQPQYNRSVEYSGRLELSDSQRNSISLLKNMLVGEIQPQMPVGARSKISGRSLRIVIGILLLLVMIFPLVTGYSLTGQQALFSPGVVAMHKTVAALPDNSSFLIISDFEPAFSGEMKAASIGVIDSLMMKGMNFSILSTIPSGAALARDLISSVRSGAFAYQPEKIAYLGYLPGGTTGLQDFVRSPREAMPLLENGRYAWTHPAIQTIDTIQDYAGILVITENTETGRAWIEQLHGVMIDKPLLMIVSAQSAPLMRPYLDSDQLSGLIGGRVEGAMYDRIMESPPRSPTVTASYQAGTLLAVVLIILGGLFGILQGLFNRHSPSSMEDLHVG